MINIASPAWSVSNTFQTFMMVKVNFLLSCLLLGMARAASRTHSGGDRGDVSGKSARSNGRRCWVCAPPGPTPTLRASSPSH